MTIRIFLPLCMGAALVLSGCGGGSGSDPAPAAPPAAPVAQGDPLYEYQWHLNNTGQSSFSSEAGMPGIDLNVASVLDAGIAGRGVRVLVIDSGVDIRHPDLAANIDAAMLRNIDPRAPDANDPTPSGSDTDAAHGTAVAGIIAAVAHNGIGGRGVAPAASLGAVNALDCASCDETTSFLDAYGGAPFSKGAEVINASYGNDPLAPQALDVDTDAILRALRGLSGLRNGKGTVMVKGSGNAFQDFSALGAQGEKIDVDPCGPARAHGLSCQNPVFDPESAMPQVITVGAVNARGVRSSYSSAGASLLVAGLGGEYGLARSRNPAEAGAALLTTDLSGCKRGVVQNPAEDPPANDFNNPRSESGKRLNAQCDYTSNMNGTSAAAPTVTGVAALMLAANPNLTWRDMRLILARTARQIDARIAPRTLPLAHGSYVAESAWTTNAAGLRFHNWYGYGLVNGAAAVAMARAYTSHLPGNGLLDSGWLDASPGASAGLQLTVPLEDPAGASSQLQFGSARTIEAVQVRVSIEGQGSLGDLGIELLSPGGTRSLLMTAHNAFQSSSRVDGLLLTSNAFNEEQAQGAWTLRVVDVNGRQASGASGQAVLANWSLRIHGR